MKKTLKFRSLRVELDRSQVFPDDPGNGTPALVFGPGCSSTYWCAIGEGELLRDKGDGVYVLTESQFNWLESIEQEITDFLYREIQSK